MVDQWHKYVSFCSIFYLLWFFFRHISDCRLAPFYWANPRLVFWRFHAEPTQNKWHVPYSAGNFLHRGLRNPCRVLLHGLNLHVYSADWLIASQSAILKRFHLHCPIVHNFSIVRAAVHYHYLLSAALLLFTWGDVLVWNHFYPCIKDDQQTSQCKRPFILLIPKFLARGSC